MRVIDKIYYIYYVLEVLSWIPVHLYMFHLFCSSVTFYWNLKCTRETSKTRWWRYPKVSAWHRPFCEKRLSDTEKYELMKNVYKPDVSFKFPSSKFGGKNRSFQFSWLARYPGLCYSPQFDAAFCMYCVLFTANTDKRGKLVTNPFTNWKKATEQFDEHFLHKRHNSGDSSGSSHKVTGTGYLSHKHCMTLGLNFLDVMGKYIKICQWSVKQWTWTKETKKWKKQTTNEKGQHASWNNYGLLSYVYNHPILRPSNFSNGHTFFQSSWESSDRT